MPPAVCSSATPVRCCGQWFPKAVTGRYLRTVGRDDLDFRKFLMELVETAHGAFQLTKRVGEDPRNRMRQASLGQACGRPDGICYEETNLANSVSYQRAHLTGGVSG